MSKGVNQKLKLLYLMKILQERTDEVHSITMQEIIATLEQYDISAERKSIYTDIQALCEYGVDIVKVKKGKEYCYYVDKREFELAELKLLVDAVQASRFITTTKSKELITKLKNLTSKNEAIKLQRQVVVTNRAKAMNEEILEIVDKIHVAITENRNISFQYYDWNREKQVIIRHDGMRYQVSPYALSWEDENYYLISYDVTANIMKHFRVDRIMQLQILEEPREGKEIFKDFDIATYSNKIFGMFGGKEEVVKLEFQNRFAGVVIDRFGKEVSMIPVGETHFRINVKVLVSNQFLGWIFALGEGVEIKGPTNVRKLMEDELKAIQKIYTRL